MQPVESVPRRSRQTGRRSALLAALCDAGRPLAVGEVAAAAGIAESTAQFHLSLLVSAGLAARAPSRSGSAGRPSWLYVAPPPAEAPGAASPDAASPDAYQELARVLAAQIDDGAEAATVAREAGRRWADAVPSSAVRPASNAAEAVVSLTGVLAGLGFAPEPPTDTSEIVLRACPLEAVAREHRAVVCGVHLGLLERTAAAIGGGLAIGGLEPFRSDLPLACAVSLQPTG